MMIYKWNFLGKHLVTSTEILESMIKYTLPTYVEAIDEGGWQQNLGFFQQRTL